MAYKLIAIVVIIILSILFLVSAIEYIPPTGNEPARLGIGWQRGKKQCVGKLSVTSRSMDGKCEFRVDVSITNCEKEKWFVFKGVECDDLFVCGGDVLVPESRWKCEWSDVEGSYIFVLCTDGAVKAMTRVSCP